MREDSLAAPVSTVGGAMRAPNLFSCRRGGWLKLSIEGMGGTAGERVSLIIGNVVKMREAVRSEFAAPPQMWSPIMEISTWLPHDEHFMVGMKADSRGTAMLAGWSSGCGDASFARASWRRGRR